METIKLVARREDPSRPHDPPGGPMVPDYESLFNKYGSVRRYIGRKLDATQGETVLCREIVLRGGKYVEEEVQRKLAVFVPYEGTEAIVEKPLHSQYAIEYLKHLRSGDLLPGDLTTAKWAGVDFDPKFRLAAAETVGAKPKTANGG